MASATSRKALETESGYKPRPKRAKPKPRSEYKDPLTPGVAKSPLAKDLHQKKEKSLSAFRRFLQLLGGK